jgi:hypothetical protein
MFNSEHKSFAIRISHDELGQEGPAMTQLTERSKALCKRALELCEAAKVMHTASAAAIKRLQEVRDGSAAKRLMRNSTQLRIFIDIYSYEFFVNHLSRRSISWDAINTAPLLGRTRVVECDGVEAYELLLRARASCPGAIAMISEAIHIASYRPKASTPVQSESSLRCMWDLTLACFAYYATSLITPARCHRSSD